MNRFYTFMLLIIRPFFFIFHPYKVIGRERIPAGGALVCANHTSLSDPFYIAMAFTRRHQLRIMAKAEAMRIPVIGRMMKWAGIFGVERGKSDVGAIKTAMRCLKNGEKLLIFPEGTRVPGGGQAKTGAALLAMRTSVPVVPVWLPAKKRWFLPTTVVIGEPYYPAAGRGGAEEYRAIADEIMDRVAALKEETV